MLARMEARTVEDPRELLSSWRDDDKGMVENDLSLTSQILHAFSGWAAATSNCVPQATHMSRSSLVFSADIVEPDRK